MIAFRILGAKIVKISSFLTELYINMWRLLKHDIRCFQLLVMQMQLPTPLCANSFADGLTINFYIDFIIDFHRTSTVFLHHVLQLGHLKIADAN